MKKLTLLFVALLFAKLAMSQTQTFTLPLKFKNVPLGTLSDSILVMGSDGSIRHVKTSVVHSVDTTRIATKANSNTLAQLQTRFALKANLAGGNFLTGNQTIIGNAEIQGNIITNGLQVKSGGNVLSQFTAVNNGNVVAGGINFLLRDETDGTSRGGSTVRANLNNTVDVTNYLPLSSGTLLNSNDIAGVGKLASNQTWTGTNTYNNGTNFNGGVLINPSSYLQVQNPSGNSALKLDNTTDATSNSYIGTLDFIIDPILDGPSFQQRLQSNPSATAPSTNKLPLTSGTLLNGNDITNLVTTNTVQSISGVKTFQGQLNGASAVFTGSIDASGFYGKNSSISSAGNGAFNGYVSAGGDGNFGGAGSFAGNVRSNPPPTLGDHLTNKTYVDNLIGRGSAVATLGTITAGTSTSISILVSGAVMGDAVVIGLPDQDFDEMVVTARVSATGSVRVTFKNVSSSTLTFTAGTYTARVLK